MSEVLKIGTGLELKKLELNEFGDYISVATGKANQQMFDDFVALCKVVTKKSEEYNEKCKELSEKYKTDDGLDNVLEKVTAFSCLEREFAKEVTVLIDGVFGEDTVRKYLRKFYDSIPNFVPGVSCFIDFIEQITPVMEQLFDQKALFDKSKMRKYQPQDHKRKS